MAGTESATPSKVINSDSERRLATALGSMLDPADVPIDAEAADHALERAQQADHGPERAEHGQHADFLLHLGRDGLAHPFHRVAGFGQTVGQFGDARGQQTAEERIVFLDQGVNALEIALLQEAFALRHQFGGAATSIRISQKSRPTVDTK